MYNPQPAIRNSQFGSIALDPIACAHFLFRSYHGGSSSDSLPTTANRSETAARSLHDRSD
jgi:hypothetical protein